MVVHASAQDTRRQHRRARALQAAESTLQATARTAAQQAECGRAEADAAEATLHGGHAASHRVDVTGEARPLEGRGRPRPDKARTIQALRARLQTTISAQTERRARLEAEAGGFVLLTQGPTAGDLAHHASARLPVDKDHQGTEQHDGFLQAPVLVKRRFVQKPERLEAWGRLVWLALRRWRVRARTMRTAVDPTSTPVPGWEKQATERPTSCMMVTQLAGVIVWPRGAHRQLARPLSVVQPPSRQALDVPVAYGTGLKSGAGGGRCRRDASHSSRSVSCAG